MGYWKYSPLSLVGNVKTPTLVVVGSEDYRTPVSEAEQYYTALQAARHSDGTGENHRREPRRHCRPAEPGRRQGQRDPRLVRPLPHRQGTAPVASNESGFPGGALSNSNCNFFGRRPSSAGAFPRLIGERQ